MLDQIRSAGYFTLLQSRPPASEEDIQQFVNYFGDGYGEYLDLATEATEIEFGSVNGRYARISSPGNCIEAYESYRLADWLPLAVPVGDDGSCSFIHYGCGSSGAGLYISDYTITRPEDSVWLARSLSEFLIEGKGVDLLK